MEAYLVGGLVRDLFLQVGSVDLDIAVVGDGVGFAREIGELFGARVTTYDRFLTAELSLPDSTRLDVATAREETYARPGMLPDVKPSTIERDLVRRDVTINAMAIALNPERFGALVDPHGGVADLQARLLRVLHPKSFLDDPTRVLRLARFAARFGFTVEAKTRGLLREALAARVFDELSADRLRHEIFLALSEPKPARVFAQLGGLKVLPVVLPGAQPGGSFPRLIERAKRLVAYVEPSAQWDLAVVGLLLLLREACAEELALAAQRLNLTARVRKSLLQAAQCPGLAQRAERTKKLSALHEVLRGLSLEVVLAALVLVKSEPTRGRMLEYLRRGRRPKLELTGDDLLAMGYAPGPGVKRMLDALLNAKLDGEVVTRQQEEAYVRRHFAHSDRKNNS